MGKQKQKTQLGHSSAISAIHDRQMMKYSFYFILVACVFIFYGNTLSNKYALDDFYVTGKNKQTARGFSAIPEIFTTPYATDQGMTYGYRPLVRISFALEHQFTNQSEYKATISHLVNLLLYLALILLLFGFLKKLLKNYSYFLPFLIVYLFTIHPIHSEVVASLKNRDILLMSLFSFLSIASFVRWVEQKSGIFFLTGSLLYVLALLSKETAVAQLAVIPLFLYYFTSANKKQLAGVAAVNLILVFMVLGTPLLLLADGNQRVLLPFENPLVAEESIWRRTATIIYILGFYLKMVFIPWPMRYYYGLNMIPVTSWGNPWVWLSLLVYGLMIYVLVKGIKKRSLLSFAIAYFLTIISMYSNIVAPVPGIVADRFLFLPSLSAAIFLSLLIYKLGKLPLKTTDAPSQSNFFHTALVFASSSFSSIVLIWVGFQRKLLFSKKIADPILAILLLAGFLLNVYFAIRDRGIAADGKLFNVFFIPFVWYVVYRWMKIRRRHWTLNNTSWMITTLVMIALLFPTAYLTISRNYAWNNHYRLYLADMPHLENSARANYLMATEELKIVSQELAKPVNPYKFIKGKIDKAERHLKKTIELDPTHQDSYIRLGNIYAKIHANQALLRSSSYQKRNETEKAASELAASEKLFEQALNYYRMAMRQAKPAANLYYNMGYAFDLQQKWDSAAHYYRASIELNPDFAGTYSKLANVYFRQGDVNKAFQLNQKIMELAPDKDIAYVNLGNYYVLLGDTLQAISNFERAAEISYNPNVLSFLVNYFQNSNQADKAEKYKAQLLNSSNQAYNPEDY